MELSAVCEGVSNGMAAEPLLWSWTYTDGKVGKQMGTGGKESLTGQLFGYRVVCTCLKLTRARVV